MRPRLRLRPLGLVLSTVLATGVALMVPVPANAEVEAVHDQKGDFWHDTRSSGDDPYPGNPDWGNPDLRRTTYAHDRSEVRVRFKMARLSHHDGGYWQTEARFRTDEGVKRWVTMTKPFDSPKWIEWHGPGKCDVDAKIDFADDVFVLVVPRSCLGNPSKVSFRAATRWWPTSDDYPYLDIAGTDGYTFPAWSTPLARD